MAKKFKNAFMMSVAVAAIVCPTMAFAQDAPQSAEADTAKPDTDIVVTGIRGSLDAAQRIKRNASSVVEAVTTEDLGKFSDLNVADSLQRVPGLQIERNDSGNNGDRVSIRGLGPDFVQTTINGRTPLSYGNEGITSLRAFNLDIVPSEIITGVKIFKTPTAELVEPGLAGAVELQTLRPLDYRSSRGDHKVFGALTARGDYDSLADRFSPRFSGIVGAKLADDRIGFYVGGVWANTQVRQDEFTINQGPGTIRVRDTAGGPVRSISNVLLPNPTTSINDGESQRRSVVAGFQVRPNDNLEFNGDFLFSRYNRFQERNDVIYNLPNVFSGVFNPGSYTLSSGALSSFNQAGIDYTGVAADGRAAGLQLINLTYNNLADNYQGGANVIWKDDNWNIKLDYSYSKSALKQDLIIPTDGGFPLSNLNVVYDARGSIPQVNVGSNSILATSLYDQVPIWIRRQYQNNSDQNAIRLDISRRISDRTTVKVGARYSSTNVDVRNTQVVLVGAAFGGTDYTLAQDAALGAAQVTGQTVTYFPGYNIGTNTFPLLQRIAPNPAYNSIINRSTFGRGTLGGDFATAADRNGTVDGFSLNPDSNYAVRERTTAAYVQLDTGGDFGSLPFDANFGLRAVNVNERAQAYSSVQVVLPLTLQPLSSRRTVVTDTNDYWEFLPAANLTLHPSSNVNVRLSAARTMSLPQYEQLAPANTLTVISPTNANGTPAVGFDPNSRGVGSAGNTQLKPLTAWQFDATLEVYNRFKGALYASVYYKKVSNFPLAIARTGVTVPGQPGLFDLFQVSNYTDGKVFGAEIGVNQPFTFLPAPWDGFGVQANYNYADTSFDRNDPALQQGFPGASKHNVNGTIYYEKSGFAIRAAYVYRSDYLALLAQPTVGRASQPTSTRGFGTLDASISYKVTPNFELVVAGSNLTETNRYDYTGTPDVTRAFFTRPRIISFSIRATY